MVINLSCSVALLTSALLLSSFSEALSYGVARETIGGIAASVPSDVTSDVNSSSLSSVCKMAIRSLRNLMKEIIQLLSGTLNVDALGSESSASGEIDTGTESSPKTILTPSSNKKLSTRSVYMSTDSTSGEIEAKFPTSNILLGKLYCAKQTMVTLQQIPFQGATNEAIQISWSDLSTNAKIFWAIRYKEIT